MRRGAKNRARNRQAHEDEKEDQIISLALLGIEPKMGFK
jgi:hypothetical protein